jgi:hypothetical protein
LQRSTIFIINKRLFSPENAAAVFDIFAHLAGIGSQSVFLRRAHALGGKYVHGDVLVAAAGAAQEGYALAAEPEHRTGLGALGDGELDLAVKRRDLDVRAERRQGKAHVRAREDGGAVALEGLVPAHGDRDQQVASGAAVAAGVALALHGYGLAVVYAGGYVHAELAVAAHIGLALAGRAGLVDYLAGAAALRAGALGLHHAEGGALRRADAAGAVAVRADLGRRAGRAARAVAVRALLHLGDVYLLLAAEGRLLKADGDRGAQALAAFRAAALRRAAAETKDVAQVAEYISKAAEAAKSSKARGPVKTAEALRRIEGRVTVLVILCALFRVAQNLSGLVYLLELRLGVLVAGVEVGVVLLRQLPVCLFDLFLRGALLQAEHLVIVPFLFRHLLFTSHYALLRAHFRAPAFCAGVVL